MPCSVYVSAAEETASKNCDIYGLERMRSFKILWDAAPPRRIGAYLLYSPLSCMPVLNRAMKLSGIPHWAIAVWNAARRRSAALLEAADFAVLKASDPLLLLDLRLLAFADLKASLALANIECTCFTVFTARAFVVARASLISSLTSAMSCITVSRGSPGVWRASSIRGRNPIMIDRKATMALMASFTPTSKRACRSRKESSDSAFSTSTLSPSASNVDRIPARKASIFSGFPSNGRHAFRSIFFTSLNSSPNSKGIRSTASPTHLKLTEPSQGSAPGSAAGTPAVVSLPVRSRSSRNSATVSGAAPAGDDDDATPGRAGREMRAGVGRKESMSEDSCLTPVRALAKSDCINPVLNTLSLIFQTIALSPSISDDPPPLFLPLSADGLFNLANSFIVLPFISVNFPPMVASKGVRAAAALAKPSPTFFNAAPATSLSKATTRANSILPLATIAFIPLLPPSLPSFASAMIVAAVFGNSVANDSPIPFSSATSK